jgi:2-polyprenyl-6-methoxyphenol hydroxylase-like FAD-dependent oxidoreductase
MRVLIIGGGVGGLCLAQALRKAGMHDIAVYERDDSADGRMQGYRLRISPDGERALRECLPERAQRLVTATSHERFEGGLAAYDDQLQPLWAPSFPDPRADDPDKIDALDRMTLRRVLLGGLADVVHFGRTFTGCEYVTGDDGRRRVLARFADGGTDVGDVLVAADGAGSRVRAGLRPADATRDLGVRAVLSRTPRAAALAAGMPEILRDRFVYIKGTSGDHLGLMPMVFRNPPATAAARIWPEVSFPPTHDYYMSVFSVHRELLKIEDDEFFAMDGTRLRDLVLARTAGWHPDLRNIFAHAEVRETHPIALRATLPVERWDTPAVVPLGDAVHTMPPTGGVGANTAMQDAAVLAGALVAAQRGERDLTDALAGYQDEMVRHSTRAIEMSLKIAKWSIERFDIDDAEFGAGAPAASH